MNKNTGFIVILAYPDVIVRVANGELISKIWPLFGVGGQKKVMAGHAAMLLVSKETGKVNYFDFGRYITSDTFGRVRSEVTDNEVAIPFKAIHDGNEISNLEEILLFLDKHPEKTHGEGRLVAGVNSEIDYDKALAFILDLQNKGEVAYGAFKKDGNNCARFVTDTILESTSNKKNIRDLKISYIVTPSPVSNVLKGSSPHLKKWQVENGVIEEYRNNSILREYKRSLFAKVPQEVDDVGSVIADTKSYDSASAQWLGGIGSGAWFEIFKKSKESDCFEIIRRNRMGVIDLEGDFKLKDDGFDLDQKFEFQYGSNCKECRIKQNGRLFVFERIMSKSA